MKLKYQISKPDTFGNNCGSFIAIDDHRTFVDQLLRQAIETCHDTINYPPPLDFDNAANDGLGRTALLIPSREFNDIIGEMRAMIQNDIFFEEFAHFFLVCYTHGMKRVLEIGDENTDYLVNGLKSQPIDTESDLFDQKLVYADIAFVIRPPKSNTRAYTGLWVNRKYLTHLFFPIDHATNKFTGNFRVDNFCGFVDCGGWKYTQKNHKYKSLQTYTVSKHAFFKRSNTFERQGKDISAKDVWNLSDGFHNWVVSLLVFFVLLCKKKLYTLY